GSGLSYLRIENGQSSGKIARFSKNLFGEGGSLGRIARFCQRILRRENPTASLFDPSNLEILVVLYAGTVQASLHLKSEMAKLRALHKIPCEVILIHQFDNSLCTLPKCNSPMERLIEGYYDRSIEDQHTGVGGTDVKYGFAQCGLALVLPHNTPNNSLA